MLDSIARKMIDPPLNTIGLGIHKIGVSPNVVTWTGLAFGIASAVMIANQYWLTALTFILLNRIMDGLDGAVARAGKKTDLGGYLDIVFDFFFYGAVPIAFAIADPNQNALASAALLFSFYANGSTFLAFAIMAEKRGLETSVQGSKSLYYLGGLAEGTETIIVFCLMCLFPQFFAIFAYIFAAICIVSSLARVVSVIGLLKSSP